MDMFVIDGGRRLRGIVRVSGSKNAALPIMAASLMVPGPVTLSGVPDLVDVETMTQLLQSMGAAVTRDADRMLLQADEVIDGVAPWELVRRMRASICVLGPLLARFGTARVSLPGGCNIGLRPVDLHLKGLAALGASVRVERGDIFASARELRGAEMDLRGPHGTTVTGTCNVMMAATGARGRTVIRHAAREPEVQELARFLTAVGAHITGAGTDVIEVQGTELSAAPQFHIGPDRIEAVTLAAAAALCGEAVRIENAPVASLTAVFEVLHAMGVPIETHADHVIVSAADHLRSQNFLAAPWPGIPTDVQAQLMALLAVADGTSRITDTVFPDRFLHAAELNRMGADIRVTRGTAAIRGVRRLSGSPVTASDLRASAALVIAALAADGQSEIHSVHHLDRGYEQLERRLNSLGACIVRCDERTRGRLVPIPHIVPTKSAPSRTPHPSD